MSSFTKDLSITQLKDKQLWRVNKSFEYHIGTEDSNEIIKIPEGYITDGASIPRFLWGIIGHPFGEYAQAAVVHDFICQYRLYSRKRCDEIFLEAMKVLKVPLIKRRLMFRAVRMFGWIAWNRKKRPQKK